MYSCRQVTIYLHTSCSIINISNLTYSYLPGNFYHNLYVHINLTTCRVLKNKSSAPVFPIQVILSLLELPHSVLWLPAGAGPVSAVGTTTQPLATSLPQKHTGYTTLL